MGEKGNIQWWQLSLIGVGCIIGTGYFLGSGLALKLAGASSLLAYLLAALATYIVYSVLAKMTVQDPQIGSFRTYAKKAYGHWAGFSSGWVYWCSEMLIMGSQMTALSLFTRFWFPHVPLWMFACGFGVLGIFVVMMGTKGFDRLENGFAVIKTAAILMFIVIAILALCGLIGGEAYHKLPASLNDFFPHGIKGFWGSMIFAFYGFGGIEIMGIMAIQLRNKKDAPKAGRIMLLILTAIYAASIVLAVIMVPLNQFGDKESPFVIALEDYHLPFFPHVFNAALIIAGFSTMVASLFSVTTMLVTLAEDGDAPHFFIKKKAPKGMMPWRALGLTVGGMLASVVAGLLLPGKIYEYITTAASLMLIYNWGFVLLSSFKLLELTAWDKVKVCVAIALIFLAVTGTLADAGSRPGLFVSLLFLLIIGAVILKIRHAWKKEPKRRPHPKAQFD